MTSRKVLTSPPCRVADSRLNSVRRLSPVLHLLLLLIPFFLHAETPATFAAEYEARYGGFRARAERSLLEINDGDYEMTTSIRLKLLGKTVSAINESSVLELDPISGLLRPIEYTFIQTGLGKRKRTISFDWNQDMALAVIGNDKIEIPLKDHVFDSLSAYLELQNQLLAGKQEIVFSGIDTGEVEEYRYRVTGEEIIDTALGAFRTLRLLRIREPDSDRNTEIWLAVDWDYLLIKLIQEEPGSRTISLELKKATVNGGIVDASKNDAIAVAD